MNIDKIIKEEINKYIYNIINEEEQKKSSKAKEQENRIARRDGKNVSRSDEENMRNELVGDNDSIYNIAALARIVYPNHTPEGAQSQLRKKLKGEKNDYGSEYHLKDRELQKIRKELK